MIRRLRPLAFALSATLLLLTTGCQPGPIWDSGDSSSDGGTDESGDTGDGAARTSAWPTCVELYPGEVTCWAAWGGTWAQIALPCHISALVAALALGPAYHDDLEDWGPVECHLVLGGDNSICLLGDGVILSRISGAWEPNLSDDVWLAPAVEPPC